MLCVFGVLYCVCFLRVDLLGIHSGMLRLDERVLLVLIVGYTLFLVGWVRCHEQECGRCGDADQGKRRYQ